MFQLRLKHGMYPVLLLIVVLSLVTLHHIQASESLTQHSVHVPIMRQSAPVELVVHDPSITNDWQASSAQGFEIQLPAGWAEVPLGEAYVGGVETRRYVAPFCADVSTSVWCESNPEAFPDSVVIGVEHRTNQSLPITQHMFDYVERHSYRRIPALLDGQSATLFLPHDGSDLQVIVFFESADIRYQIWFNQELWFSTGRTANIRPILGTINFDPATAPEPWLQPAFVEKPQPSNAPESIQELAEVDINLEALIDYAMLWGSQANNINDCYIYTDPDNTTIRCSPEPGINVGRDGAHFVYCALASVGFGSFVCSPNYYANILGTIKLYEEIISQDVRAISKDEQPLPGDILFVRPSNPCWSAIVVPSYTFPPSVNLAIHSMQSTVPEERNRNDLSIDTTLYCDRSLVLPERQYLRLKSDLSDPTVAFTESVPAVVPFNSAVSTAWRGNDDVGGSGIQGYALFRVVNGAETVLIPNEVQTSFTESLSTPCSTVQYRVIAIDNVNRQSVPDTLEFTVSLEGDFDLDGAITNADVELLEQRWGALSGDAHFEQQYDLNADGKIDSADYTWLYQRLGNQCS